MGKKMWTFGPAKVLIQQHLATFKDWPTYDVGVVSSEVDGIDAEGVGR